MRKPSKTALRNPLEHFNYQYEDERIENINDQNTHQRVLKYNKRYDPIIERSKQSVKLYNLLGYSQTQYILFRQIQHWMQTHKYSIHKTTQNINNIQFARDFFAAIDQTGSGKSSVQGIAVPMIALGLSSNSSFVTKVMKAICPYKFGKMT